MRTIIAGGHIVNEGRIFEGSIVVDDDRITEITEGNITPRGHYDKQVDATGCYVLPGIIDDHVHFREPGLTRKADLESESRAAAYGGVTSFFDMPNTIPQATTLEALEDKFALAAEKSHVNYSFFPGATNGNAELYATLDRTRIPGIKLFMGASTGNMLVDKQVSLENIYRTCAELGLPLMTHCEDTALVNRNLAAAKAKYGEDPDITQHPLIRSAEACYASSALAVQLAERFGTRLHIAHISTARELDLLPMLPASAKDPLPRITGEAVVSHLWFTDEDYPILGTRIKCNPAVKTDADRAALRAGLTNGRIAVVGTDHAPHEHKDKEGGAAKAASGMPMIQFSLVAMLSLADEGVLSLERLVELMCHNPARLFEISSRGFLRPGYKADIAIVKPVAPWTATDDMVQSKCGWTPMVGQTFRWKVVQTFCNGHLIYNNGVFDENSRGEAVRFRMANV
jgi:dihydroorotase